MFRQFFPNHRRAVWLESQCEDAQLILGVSGSSYAPISWEILTLLEQTQYRSVVIATPGGARFLERNARHAIRDVDWHRCERPLHVLAGEHSRGLIVAPASANTLVAAAYGLATNLLTATILSTRARKAYFPAMSRAMWEAEPIQRAVRLLRSSGDYVSNVEYVEGRSGGEAVAFTVLQVRSYVQSIVP